MHSNSTILCRIQFAGCPTSIIVVIWCIVIYTIFQVIELVRFLPKLYIGMLNYKSWKKPAPSDHKLYFLLWAIGCINNWKDPKIKGLSIFCTYCMKMIEHLKDDIKLQKVMIEYFYGSVVIKLPQKKLHFLPQHKVSKVVYKKNTISIIYKVMI